MVLVNKNEKTKYRASLKFSITDKKSENYKKLYDVCYESGKLYNEVLSVIIKCREGDFQDLEEFKDLFNSSLDITSNKFYGEFLKIYRAKFGLDNNPVIICRSCEDIIKKVFINIDSYFSKKKRREKRDKNGYRNNGNEPEFPKVQEEGFLFRCKFDSFKMIFKGDGYLHLRSKRGIRTELKIPFNQPIRNGKAKYVEIVPHNDIFKILIYTESPIENLNLDENKYLSIDLGIDNFVTMISNDGSICEIINGGELSSKILYYGQKYAKIQSMYDRQGLKDGPIKQRIMLDCENFIDNFIHKTSKYIVDLMIKHNIKYCVIGKNKNWKTKSRISNNKKVNKKFNRSFCSMPHARLIEKIRYKLEDIGGKLETIREDNTSKCSSFDSELLPCGNKHVESKKNFNGSRGIRQGEEVIVVKDKRGRNVEIHYDPTFKTKKGNTITYHTIKKNHKGEDYLTTVRGLFFTANNKQIVNSDVNGAFNILRKFFIAKDKNLNELVFHQSFFNPEKKYVPL